MILEVRHLRVVDAIHREGTVSRAAERLHLTQSAVSHALRDLEERLSIRLFRRENRRMAATGPGRRLLKTATLVLEEIRQAEKDIGHQARGSRSSLRIATQCYTCYAWLPRVLEDFMRDFPAIELEIVPEATDDPVEALLTGDLDLAILHERARRDDVLERPLFHDEFVAILPEGHPLAVRHFLRPIDFRNQHLILHSNPETSHVITHFLSPAGIRPERVSQLRLTEAVVEAVRAGLGVTALSGWVAAPRLKRGGLAAVRLSAEGLRRTWTAAMMRERSDERPLLDLVELIRRHARPFSRQPTAVNA